MAIAFRADASDEIGNGHIMRCVTLANTLAEQGEACIFICRSLTDPARNAVVSNGHSLHMLPDAKDQNDRPMAHAHWLKASWQQDAVDTAGNLANKNIRWLVVDHYGIDMCWEQTFKSDDLKLAVIDDLADRTHLCDVLLDQNLHAQPYLRYHGLVPDATQTLLGPRYALLRSEFSGHEAARFEGTNVLVAFSGADQMHLTLLALHALEGHTDVTVVVNRQNSDLVGIRAVCSEVSWSLYPDADNMAELMKHAAIAIGAGGGMVWERAALGLPSIAIITAENQRQQVLNAEAAGMLYGLDGATLTVDTLKQSFEKIQSNPSLKQSMSTTCRRAVDGKGRRRVAERLLPSNVKLREAIPFDSETVWRWRNHPAIRRVSRQGEEIAWSNHKKWFSSVLQNPKRQMLLASDPKGDLGVVRFDCENDGAEISIYLAPQRLGEGRGAALLLAAESWLANRFRHALTIRAEVLNGNLASEELFRSCGYVFAAGMFRKTVGKK